MITPRYNDSNDSINKVLICIVKMFWIILFYTYRGVFKFCSSEITKYILNVVAVGEVCILL